MRFEESTTINAPAEKVFDYVADVTRHPEWAGTPLETKMTSSGTMSVGSTFGSVGKQFGKHKNVCTITEYVPGTKIAFDSTGDHGLFKHWFALSESGGQTKLTKGMDLTAPSIMSRLFSPYIKRNAPKALKGDLAKIKSRVEGTA
jgi:uncharacterized protein YndB with AHSA1/START domain